MSKWNGAYLKIKTIVLEGETMRVWFMNGDEVKLALSSITPTKIRRLSWAKASVTRGGLNIVVPASPSDVMVSGDLIRRLTDPRYARHVAERAERQARVVGFRIRELRLSRGLTQVKVAEGAGIEQANLSRIENGQFDISSSTLWRVLAVMGFSPEDLAASHSETERDSELGGRAIAQA